VSEENTYACFYFPPRAFASPSFARSIIALHATRPGHGRRDRVAEGSRDCRRFTRDTRQTIAVKSTAREIGAEGSDRTYSGSVNPKTRHRRSIGTFSKHGARPSRHGRTHLRPFVTPPLLTANLESGDSYGDSTLRPSFFHVP